MTRSVMEEFCEVEVESANWSRIKKVRGPAVSFEALEHKPVELRSNSKGLSEVEVKAAGTSRIKKVRQGQG